MLYYLISHRGHPLAMVRSIRLARDIVRCRPEGFYAIEEIAEELENDSPDGPCICWDLWNSEDARRVGVSQSDRETATDLSRGITTRSEWLA
jgi:hypothetical protein